MICPKCFSEIPDDSSYCDMCGVKILICPACGLLGTDSRCLVDNSKMIANGDEPVEKKFFKTERKPSARGEIYLKLVNKNLNIEIKVVTGDVLGRKTKTSSKELGGFKQISSRHAAMEFKAGVGWFVTDMNTTNGTKINDKLLEAMTPAKIQHGDTLILANIEFFVSQ